MKILSIETSCDETAAAIVEDQNFRPVVLSNIVASQMEVHAATGGVIPNIAARLHTEALPAVLNEVTKNRTLDYDAIAVTVGPGLIGSLLVGMAAAKTLAMVEQKPFFAINHLEGHVYSAWLAANPPELPALFLIISGGHTELVIMDRHLHYRHLGSTRDDAAGEAFDKVARLLELGYPGGPAIAALALHGDETAFPFPIALDQKKNLEFSFSGLKASVVHLLNKLPQPLAEHTKADIAASFQRTVCDTVKRKVLSALDQYPGLKTVAMVGGVSANQKLRSELETSVRIHRPDCQFIVPPFEYCTDNAAMVGAAAVFRHLFGRPDSWYDVEANPNLELQ